MRVKKNLLILFGGMSNEHDISQLSVKNIIRNVNREDYNVYIVGITKMGRWVLVRDVDEIENKSWIYGDRNAYLLPDREKHALMILEDDVLIDTISIDVCFPVLHGKNGEDGTIQGLLELAGIPYVGSGVLSSAICLDKFVTKSMVADLGIDQARYIAVNTREYITIDSIDKQIQDEFGYPVFVKPSNSGSSLGITRVESKDGLEAAINLASKECKVILIEEEIRGREVECAVFGDRVARALSIGEIISADKFYSYEAKYINSESKTVVDPKLPDGVDDKIFEASTRIYETLDCYSLARVDFFIEEGTNRVVFNEINTMPGFTNISMYPMLAQDAGMSTRELVDALLETAFKR